MTSGQRGEPAGVADVERTPDAAMRARLTVISALPARAAALAAAAVARLPALARNFTLLGRIHRGESTL
jgi:hypothetical protein